MFCEFIYLDKYILCDFVQSLDLIKAFTVRRMV